MKIFSILGIIIGISLLGLVIKVVLFPVNTAQKLIQTAYDTQDKVLNADNAIYNYEWFKQAYEDIEATKEKLFVAEKAVINFESIAGERKDWTFEDKIEDARLRSVSQGIESGLKDLIATYNARAKMATRNIFQDGVLPNYIDALTFIFKK